MNIVDVPMNLALMSLRTSGSPTVLTAKRVNRMIKIRRRIKPMVDSIISGIETASGVAESGS
jgi:hypothetical protein